MKLIHLVNMSPYMARTLLALSLVFFLSSGVFAYRVISTCVDEWYPDVVTYSEEVTEPVSVPVLFPQFMPVDEPAEESAPTEDGVRPFDFNAVPTTDEEWSVFLDAIAIVESRGQLGLKVMDRGSYSYGPFQIKRKYLKDSGLNYTLESLRWDYARSKAVAKAYLQRYGKYYESLPENRGKRATFEVLARIHNGGPTGWKKASTQQYAEKVKNELS